MTHLLVGLILLGLGIWGIVAWWNVFGLVMRGIVPFGLMVLGLVAVISGYRRGAQDRSDEKTPQPGEVGLERPAAGPVDRAA